MVNTSCRTLVTEGLAEQGEAKQRMRLPPASIYAETRDATGRCKYVTHEQLQKESRTWFEMLVREVDHFNEQKLDLLNVLSELRADVQAIISKESDGETSSRSLLSKVGMSQAEHEAQMRMLLAQGEQNRQAASHSEAAVADLRHNLNMQWERHDDLIADLRETVFTMQQDITQKLKDDASKIRCEVEPFALQLSTLEQKCHTVGNRLSESSRSCADSIRDITVKVQDIYKKLPSEQSSIVAGLNFAEISKQASRIENLEALCQTLQKQSAAEPSASNEFSSLTSKDCLESKSPIEVLEVSHRDTDDVSAKRIDPDSSHSFTAEAADVTALSNIPEEEIATSAGANPLSKPDATSSEGNGLVAGVGSEQTTEFASSGTSLTARIVAVEARCVGACANLGADLRLCITDLEERVTKLESCCGPLEAAQMSMRVSGLETEVKNQSAQVLSIVEGQKRDKTIRIVNSGTSTVAVSGSTSPQTVRVEDMTRRHEGAMPVHSRSQGPIRFAASPLRRSDHMSGAIHSDNSHENLEEPCHAVTRTLAQQSYHVPEPPAKSAAPIQSGVAQARMAPVTPNTSPSLANRQTAEPSNLGLRTSSSVAQGLLSLGSGQSMYTNSPTPPPLAPPPYLQEQDIQVPSVSGSSPSRWWNGGAYRR